MSILIHIINKIFYFFFFFILKNDEFLISSQKNIVSKKDKRMININIMQKYKELINI